MYCTSHNDYGDDFIKKIILLSVSFYVPQKQVSKRRGKSFSSTRPPVVGLVWLRDVLTGFLDSWLNELELKHCIVILSSVLNSDRKVSGRGSVRCIFFSITISAH